MIKRTVSQAEPVPLLVYLHGGCGFLNPQFTSHDQFCRRLATGATCVVLAVDYRCCQTVCRHAECLSCEFCGSVLSADKITIVTELSPLRSYIQAALANLRLSMQLQACACLQVWCRARGLLHCSMLCCAARSKDRMQPRKGCYCR